MKATSFSNETYEDGFSPTIEGLSRMFPKFNTLNAGVMFNHGAGGTAASFNEAYGRQGELSTRCVNEGYLGVSGDNGGTQTWGNPTSIARMESNRQILFSMGNVEKYALVGGSMGGQNSINFAAAAKVKPSAIVCIIPVMNVEDIRANNRDGYAPLIDAAYAGGYNETRDGQFHNPYTMRNMSKLMGIPTLIFYGASDTLCLPSFVTGYCAADPTNRTAVSMPYGHQEEAYAAVDQNMVVDFLNDNLR